MFKRTIILVAAIVGFAGGMIWRDSIEEAHATNVGGSRGPAGAAGASGVTGPTGPDWSTCAALSSGIAGAEHTGSCGAVVLSTSPTLTTPVLGVATGTSLVLSSTLDVTGALGVTGLITARAAITATSTGAQAALEGTNASASGNALRVVGDTTSPAVAPVFISVADANPSSAGADGNIVLIQGGVIRTNRGSATYRAVANVGVVGTTGAAGTNQATATALPLGGSLGGTDFWTVTGCDGTKGVTLPQGAAGVSLRIMAQSSTVTNTCNIFGHNSDNDTINGAAADAVYVQIAGSSLVYYTADGTAWFTY